MGVMKRNLIAMLAALAFGATVGAALGGCGSQTKTVSVAGAPVETQTTTGASTTQATTTASTATAPSTTPAPTSTDGGAAAPGATRTASEPEFTQQEAHGEGASEAVAALKAAATRPTKPPSTTPTKRCGCSSAPRPAPATATSQQAFFFVDGHYIGTDTKEPSASVTSSPRATPKSRSPTRSTARAIRSPAPAAVRRSCASSSTTAN